MKLQGLITLVCNQLLGIVSTFNFLDHLISNEIKLAVFQTSNHRAADCLRGTLVLPKLPVPQMFCYGPAATRLCLRQTRSMIEWFNKEHTDGGSKEHYGKEVTAPELKLQSIPITKVSFSSLIIRIWLEKVLSSKIVRFTLEAKRKVLSVLSC